MATTSIIEEITNRSQNAWWALDGINAILEDWPNFTDKRGQRIMFVVSDRLEKLATELQKIAEDLEKADGTR